MKIDIRLLDILVNKPDLVNDFPEWMLSQHAIDEIKAGLNVAVAEIAGRDSIAAIIQACKLKTIKAIVPTIAYTATEYGDWNVSFKAIDFLREKLLRQNILIYNPVVVGSPKFWGTLCGRYATHMIKKYGFYTSCVGCHLYFHAVRIPLAKKLGCNLIIGGERESHDGRIKVNQIGVSLDAYRNLVNRFKIELFLPIRHIKSGSEIETILGSKWDEGGNQLECVLSKNYQEMDGTVVLDENAVKGYLYNFAIDKAEEVIKGYLSR